MLFYYIRHGTPTYKPDDLTEEGELQAKALAERLSFTGVDKIFSSDSVRALKTAKFTADNLNKEITVLPWANENLAAKDFYVYYKDIGGWTYENEELLKVFNSAEVFSLGEEWTSYPLFSEYNFKSGIERIAKEADNFFGNLGYIHNRKNRTYTINKGNDEKVALFAHSGFGMAFLSSVLDIPYPLFITRFQQIAFSGVTIIDFSGGKESFPRIISYSDNSHLYKNNMQPFNCIDIV